MPAARETLLEAARTAVGAQPWADVRMVDIATAAGVSRQTLYNEFGSKEGLGTALVNRLVDRFVDGAVRAAAEVARGGADPGTCCAAAAAWMLRTARDEPIVHGALTGCRSKRMPLPAANGIAPSDVRADRPGRMATALCERLVAGLSATGPPADGLTTDGPSGELGPAYAAGLRIALSYVVAPSGQRRDDEEALARVREVVRALLTQPR